MINPKGISLLILGVVSLLAIFSLFLMFSKAGLTGRQIDDLSLGPPKCCVNTQTGAFITIPRKSPTDVPICPASHNGDTGFPLDCETHTASFRSAQPIQPVTPQPIIDPYHCCINKQNGDFKMLSVPIGQSVQCSSEYTYFGNEPFACAGKAELFKPKLVVPITPTLPSPQQPLTTPTNDLSLSQGQLPTTFSATPVLGSPCDSRIVSNRVIGVCEVNKAVGYYCKDRISYSDRVTSRRSSNWQIISQQECPNGCEIINNNAQCKPQTQQWTFIDTNPAHCCINSKYNAEWTSQNPCPAGFIDKGVQNDCSTIASKLKQEMALVQPITPALPLPQPPKPTTTTTQPTPVQPQIPTLPQPPKPVQPIVPTPIIPAPTPPTTPAPVNNGLQSSQAQLPAQPSLPPQQFTPWTPTSTYQSGDSTHGSGTSIQTSQQPQPTIPLTQQPTPEPITSVPVIGENCNFIQLSSQNMAVKQVCDNSDLVTMMCSPSLALSAGNWNELRRETCAKGCEIINNNAECKRPAIILSDLQACGSGGVINKYYGDYVSAEDCITNKWGTRFGRLLVWDEDNNEWREGPSRVFAASNSCSDSSNIKISYCGSTLVGNPQAKYVCIKKESCRSGTKCKQRDLTPAEIGTQGCMMHFSGGRCTVSECS